MKKIYIIIVNAVIMAAILIFVVLYSRFENRNSYLRQIEHFEDTTVTMERVTQNYLEGEQRLCDVWAQYINSKDMTMEEAADYIRASHVTENTSAHLVSLDTLTGLSTRPKQGTADNYAVSYERIALLKNVDWINEIGKSINITRAYTNPMNGEQSLAFCNRVTLHDPESGTSGAAVLLRVIPISVLEQKWVFPQTGLMNAELSMIDANGDYILKGSGFKNSSFFEFYKSYNPTDPESSGKLFSRITSSTGSVPMVNSHGQECILAFTPVAATAGWTMLGLVPAKDLSANTENWMLFGVVSAGLLILFLMPSIARKWSKQAFLLIGSVLLILGFVITGLAGTNTSMIVAGTIIRSFGAGPLLSAVFALVPDVVEYGNWKFGVRSEGLISSAQSIGSKVGIGLGSALTGWILAGVGYDPTAAVQTQSVINAIKFDYTWLGAIISIVILIIVLMLNVEKYAPEYMKQ